MIVASHADGLMLYRITLHNSTELPREREPDEWVYGVGGASADSDR